MKKIFIVFAYLIFVVNGFCQQNIHIMIAGKSSGTLTIKELTESRKITLNTDTVKITSFNLSCIVNGFLKTIPINSDSFNIECINVLSNQAGKKIFIEEVARYEKASN